MQRSCWKPTRGHNLQCKTYYLTQPNAQILTKSQPHKSEWKRNKKTLERWIEKPLFLYNNYEGNPIACAHTVHNKWHWFLLGPNTIHFLQFGTFLKQFLTNEPLGKLISKNNPWSQEFGALYIYNVGSMSTFMMINVTLWQYRRDGGLSCWITKLPSIQRGLPGLLPCINMAANNA